MGRGTTHKYRGALWEVRGPPERAGSHHRVDRRIKLSLRAW